MAKSNPRWSVIGLWRSFSTIAAGLRFVLLFVPAEKGKSTTHYIGTSGSVWLLWLRLRAKLRLQRGARRALGPNVHHTWRHRFLEGLHQRYAYNQMVNCVANEKKHWNMLEQWNWVKHFLNMISEISRFQNRVLDAWKNQWFSGQQWSGAASEPGITQLNILH